MIRALEGLHAAPLGPLLGHRTQRPPSPHGAPTEHRGVPHRDILGCSGTEGEAGPACACGTSPQSHPPVPTAFYSPRSTLPLRTWGTPPGTPTAARSQTPGNSLNFGHGARGPDPRCRPTPDPPSIPPTRDTAAGSLPALLPPPATGQGPPPRALPATFPVEKVCARPQGKFSGGVSWGGTAPRTELGPPVLPAPPGPSRRHRSRLRRAGQEGGDIPVSPLLCPPLEAWRGGGWALGARGGVR